MKEVTGVDFKVEEAGRRAGDAIISVVDELSPLIHLSKKLEDMCLDQYNLERKKNYA
jgi:UDP-glucose 4-epimerase